ncbi:MAG TPA: DegQ family serine endoprotease [Gallionella sp.]|nr:DegQ family serine endoprotease [Gallionella sp.]
MKRIVSVILLTLSVLTSVGCNKPTAAVPPRVAAGSAPPVAVALPSFTALVKKEGPAVVNISSVKRVRGGSPFPGLPEMSPDDPFFEFFHRFMPRDQFPREFRSQSLGSGFIISEDGYLLTNAHVIEDADEVTVRLTDQREFKAKVVGADRRSDIAVLKIPAKGLPMVNIGDSSKLEVGEWVVAIGSPFGFTNSISQGIVSAKGRSLPGENIVPFIQTDVPVNPGNSGGPLFNLNGEVVGINSQIYSRSGGYMGLSFAIPINLAIRVKDELLKHGTVTRGWLGVTIQSVTPETAKSFRLERTGGALIASVEKDSPADRAGLQIGDIILKFDGRELGSADDLTRAVAETAPGSSVKFQVWRNGSNKEIIVRLGESDGERPQKQMQPGKAIAPDQIGLALHELAPDEQRALQTDGFLLVEEVAGVAAESGIQPGDIIIAVNSQRVSSIKQLRAALTQAGKHVALLVQREGDTIFVPLKFQNG